MKDLYNRIVAFLYPAHKELSDQTLHFSYCFILAYAEMAGRVHLWSIFIAFITAYGVAMLREYYQHKHVVWLNKDLFFSGLGALSGIGFSFLMYYVL